MKALLVILSLCACASAQSIDITVANAGIEPKAEVDAGIPGQLLTVKFYTKFPGDPAVLHDVVTTFVYGKDEVIGKPLPEGVSGHLLRAAVYTVSGTPLDDDIETII